MKTLLLTIALAMSINQLSVAGEKGGNGEGKNLVKRVLSVNYQFKPKDCLDLKRNRDPKHLEKVCSTLQESSDNTLDQNYFYEVCCGIE